MNAYVYGQEVEYNEKNPSLAHLRGTEVSFIEVKALIKNNEKTWKEVFKVSSIETAEEQIKEVMDFFNSTLQKGERKREFVRLWIEDEEVKNLKDGKGMVGWLNPKGEFFPCKFGEHSVYANMIFKMAKTEDIKSLANNQHIPMSVDEKSQFSHIGILGKITEEQVTWFNRFFDKLSRSQKSQVMKKLEEQNLTLEFTW